MGLSAGSHKISSLSLSAKSFLAQKPALFLGGAGFCWFWPCGLRLMGLV